MAIVMVIVMARGHGGDHSEVRHSENGPGDEQDNDDEQLGAQTPGGSRK